MLRALLLAAIVGLAAAIPNSCTYDAQANAGINPNIDPLRAASHKWTADLRAHTAPNVNNRFGAAKLTEVLQPGSHDAGSFGVPFKACTMSNAEGYAVTQTYNMQDQLCLGYRWYDLRFYVLNGEWRVFHGDGMFRYTFDTLSEIVNQIERYASDPDHVSEVFVLRFKLDKEDELKKHKKHWPKLVTEIKRLEALLVPHKGVAQPPVPVAKKDRWNKKTTELAQGYSDEYTMQELWGLPNHAGAKIILMSYGWPAELTTQVEQGLDDAKKIWKYEVAQQGTFSSSFTPSVITAGQTEALQSGWRKSPGKSLFGFWYTATGSPKLKVTQNKNKLSLNVRRNTEPLWANPDDLELLYRVLDCEIGSFLITDFCGDTSMYKTVGSTRAANVPLHIAYEHNYNKFVAQPDADRFTGWCNAEEEWDVELGEEESGSGKSTDSNVSVGVPDNASSEDDSQTKDDTVGDNASEEDSEDDDVPTTVPTGSPALAGAKKDAFRQLPVHLRARHANRKAHHRRHHYA